MQDKDGILISIHVINVAVQISERSTDHLIHAAGITHSPAEGKYRWTPIHNISPNKFQVDSRSKYVQTIDKAQESVCVTSSWGTFLTVPETQEPYRKRQIHN